MSKTLEDLKNTGLGNMLRLNHPFAQPPKTTGWGQVAPNPERNKPMPNKNLVGRGA